MTCYKSPNQDNTTFIDFIDNILASHSKMLLCADTNINILNDNNEVNEYISTININGFKIVNNSIVTRTTKKSSTTIDHVITDTDNKIRIGIQTHDISVFDHKVIEMQLCSNIFNKRKMINTRINILNENDFITDVKNHLKDKDCENIEELIEIISEYKEINTTYRKLRNRNNSWLTFSLVKLMRQRDKLFKIYKKYPDNATIKFKYNKIKNIISRQIKIDKRKYMQNDLLNAGSDTRKVWQIINKNLYNNNNHQLPNINIDKIINNNKIFIDIHNVANEMNNYYINIGNLIFQQNVSQIINSTVIPSQTNSIYLNPTNDIEIKIIINTLKSNASPGKDKITSNDVKILQDIITPYITKYINLCLSTGIFPNRLKDTIVIPIYKSGPKTDPGNYRPIALINTIAKIYEKVINLRIKEYINKTVKFDINQFGFQEEYSTESATSETIRTIIDSIDLGNYVCAVFVDIKKAFDTVKHYTLLNILEKLGFRGNTLILIKNYLEHRSVRTKIGNCYSDESTLINGIPQGSILGPTLYLLYIHNLQYAKLKGVYKIFADDTVLIYNSKNGKLLQKMVNNDLQTFLNWMNGNSLSINVNKSKYIIFKNTNKEDVTLQIQINGNNLERVATVKYLGLHIDEKLNFNQHIKHITHKIAPILGALKRLNFVNETRINNMIYHAHILSHIRHNLTVWSMCPKYLKNKVKRLMRKSLKILWQVDRFIPTSELYKLTKQLNLDQLIFVNKASYIHKTSKDIHKIHFKLIKHSEISSRNTRKKDEIVPMKSRTALHQRSLLPSAIKVYNMIPIETKQITNIKFFTKKVKDFILYNSECILKMNEKT